MAAATYRFSYAGPSIADYLQGQVDPAGGALILGSDSPTSYVDVTADTTQLSDLTAAMLAIGYSLYATNPAATPAQQFASVNTTPHTLSEGTITASSSFVVSQYFEVAAGVTLELASGVDLEIL